MHGWGDGGRTPAEWSSQAARVRTGIVALTGLERGVGEGGGCGVTNPIFPAMRVSALSVCRSG